MPKPIKKLPAVFVQPELRRCVEKAGRAVGENSPLTDGEILLLASVAWSNGGNLARRTDPDEDADKPGIEERPEYFSQNAASLARIFSKDHAGAARAILAAHREATRIRSTSVWMVRTAIRRMAWLRLIPSHTHDHFDIQSISQRVKKMHRLNVSDKLIHKALRLEREAQNNALRSRV
jgi:hypothetical protein